MSKAPDLDKEIERLHGRLPAWAARTLRKARKPEAAWLRVPMALALLLGGLLGFLPLLGFWMAPLGLALLAADLPFLRQPMAKCLAFINRKLAAQEG